MSAIDNYTDVVSLNTAKDYLRIDLENTDSDSEVTMMIGSACNLVESYTQIYLRPQDKEYYFNSQNYIKLYAWPYVVKTPADDTDYRVEKEQLYSIFTRKNTTLESITFTVGHSDFNNVKPIILMAILETVKLWFYGSETETVMKGYIPNSVMAILSPERRFIF